MTPEAHDEAVLALVDERGRAAAAALLTAVEPAARRDGGSRAGRVGPSHPDARPGRPGPAAGHATGTQRRRGRRVVLAAAVVIVVVVGGVIALTGGDEPSTVAGGTADELVAGWLPEGMAASSAQRVGGGAILPDQVGGMVVVYGDGAAADPWAGPTLSVMSADVAPGGGPGGERITVSGHDAFVDEANGVSVSWDTGDGRIAVRGSVGVDRATVVAAAEGADGAPTIAPTALPPGFVEIGRGTLDAMMGGGGPGYLGRGAGLVLTYVAGDPSGPDAAVSVFQRPGAEDAVDLVRLTSASTRPGEVRGRAAVVGDTGSGPGAPEPFVQWREPSGLLTTVSGAGVDEATLLRIAEGLRPAQPGEIEGLAARTEDAGASSPSGTDGSALALTSEVVVGTGVHDGAEWRLLLTERGGLQQVELSYRGSAASTGWPADRGVPPFVHGTSTGATWSAPVAFGLVHAGSRVTIDLPGFDTIVPQLLPVEDEDLLGFVAFLPPGAPGGATYTVVVTDATGTEVGREVQPVPVG